MSDGLLAEIQGLYGAFSFPERLLQAIWDRRDFDVSGARTADGRTVRVLYPGRWNRLGGPDFAGARLVVGELELTGDVELHLHAKDWAQHGHAADPAYDNVVLHVVLFPCAERFTRGAVGRDIPILCLLPLLHRGLEEYAADEAMERLAGRPLHLASEQLGAMSNEEVNTTLGACATRRWRDKLRFARMRIDRLGWEGACHHAALEALGYRFNRAPMLAAATRHPQPRWAGGEVDPEVLFEELGDRWSLHGVRPLNHPRLRLRQYAAWCAARPDWPSRLRDHLQFTEMAGLGCEGRVGLWRKAVGLKRRRRVLVDELCDGVVGGNRWDNLVCDGFMPLVAAETGLDLLGAWYGWFPGDAPAATVRVLRTLGVFDGRDRPAAQGPVQGILAWIWTQESRRESLAGDTDGRGT